MSQEGQSHAGPFFLLSTGRGVIVVIWVVPAAVSERSAVEAAAVVSARRSRNVTERVTILTVSAKWMRNVSSWTSSVLLSWISVEVSRHVLTSVREVSVTFRRAPQLTDNNTIREEATSRSQVDSGLESDLILSDCRKLIS